MDAIVLKGTNDVGLTSVPDPPAPQPGEVIIEVAATGLCGTDLHEYVAGPTFSQPPVVLGHEVSGRIVEVGAGIDRCRIGGGRRGDSNGLLRQLPLLPPVALPLVSAPRMDRLDPGRRPG